MLTQAAELADDAAERDAFIGAAEGAFHALDKHVQTDGSGRFWTSKNTTMLLQGGGRFMLHAIGSRSRTAARKHK